MSTKVRVPIEIPGDYLRAYRLLARARALNEVIIMPEHIKHIPGVRITGLGQEIISVIPLFVFLKMGILENSIKNCDHRTVYGTAAVVDEETKNAGDSVILDFLRNYFMRSTGGNYGRDGNVHWSKMDRRILGLICSDMGRVPGIAVGAIEEIRRVEWPGLPKEKRPVGISFFGDGAAQQGGMHETMNWTAASNYVRTKDELAEINEQFLDDVTKETGVLRGAPMIFVVNNNQFALFTDAANEHGCSDLAARANGYGNMIGVDVDGTDPVALFQATVEAVERAQNLQSTLIVANNYRLTGHNEVQIKHRPGSIQKGDFFDIEHIYGVNTPKQKEELRKAIEKEPIFHGWSEQLIAQGYATREELDVIIREERLRITTLVEQVLDEPKITVEEFEQTQDVFPPSDQEKNVSNTTVSSEKKQMSYIESYRHSVSQLMRKDDRVTYRGQDSASVEGGVLALTKGLLEEFGPVRLFLTPLSEEAMIANIAGASLVGSRPIGELQFAPFIHDGDAVLAHAVAPQWNQKQIRYPFILVAPFGIVHGGGSGHYHEAPIERFLTTMEGIAVVFPADSYELTGLMNAAYTFDGPVAMMIQIAAAEMEDCIAGVPLEWYEIPFGKARIVHEGTDVTIVTYGASCVAAAKNEIESLAKDGFSIELIDLRTLMPCDTESIITSVQKTGRCVIFHEDYYKRGFGQMLKGELNEDERFASAIRTPNLKVVGAKTPFVPTDLDLVWWRLPYEREQVEMTDKKGRSYVKYQLRSPELVSVIKEMMKW